MTTPSPTFPTDPASMPALKRWLASQDDQSSLRPVNIDEILIGPDVLLQLPAVLQRAGISGGMTTLLVMDETPMRREEQDLKSFVQKLLRNAGYQVETLWLKGDQYGLVHADFGQVERVQAAVSPGTALVAMAARLPAGVARGAVILATVATRRAAVDRGTPMVPAAAPRRVGEAHGTAILPMAEQHQVERILLLSER